MNKRCATIKGMKYDIPVSLNLLRFDERIQTCVREYIQYRAALLRLWPKFLELHNQGKAIDMLAVDREKASLQLQSDNALVALNAMIEKLVDDSERMR